MWVDDPARKSRGLKLHAFRSLVDSDKAKCMCGSLDSSGSGIRQKSKLRKSSQKKFALMDEACENCVKALGLWEYRQHNRNNSGGIDAVNYDPFDLKDEEEEDIELEYDEEELESKALKFIDQHGLGELFIETCDVSADTQSALDEGFDPLHNSSHWELLEYVIKQR